MYRGLRRLQNIALKQFLPRTMSTESQYIFETLSVSSPAEFVKHVEFNRPEKRNAMNSTFWHEIQDCFNQLSDDKDCRVVMMSGKGPLFTAGLDLQDNDLFSLVMNDKDVSRKAFGLTSAIRKAQDHFTAIEICDKPVIAMIHNACLGAGVDLISACDIRYCTGDAWFQIKEVELGLAADMGTLQRFSKIVGNDSLCRELVYTGRTFLADEAKRIGFVSNILSNKDEMITSSLEIAKTIASKSPVAIQGSKRNIVYSRDHSVAEGLDYMATWNASMLQSEDVQKAVLAAMQKQQPAFSKL